MNKRIEELAEQAVEEMDQEAFCEDMYIPDEYLEKFADLIVKECFAVMNNLEDELKQQFKWKRDEVIPTSGHIKKLSEHFGVE